MAACYTFGSPRVGDEDWSYDIKTPIYRVINAFDCVTTLPPKGQLINIFRFILSYIPFIGKSLKNLLAHFGGYAHIGDIRYMTSCKSGKYNHVKMTNRIPRLKHLFLFFQPKNIDKLVIDHSIAIYRKKLAVIAIRRND